MALIAIFGCTQLLAQSPPKQPSSGGGASGSGYGGGGTLTLQNTRSAVSIVKGGQVVGVESKASTEADSLEVAALDSLVVVDSLKVAARDSLAVAMADSLGVAESLGVADSPGMTDSLGVADSLKAAPDSLGVARHDSHPNHPSAHGGDKSILLSQSQDVEEKIKSPYFSDSMSYRRVVGTSVFMPGFGQVYNKQAWKLPIIYGALGASTGLLIHENRTYRPLKQEYDDYTYTTSDRSDYLDNLQSDYIRSSRRRNTYIGLIAASAIYALGDAAINYSTGDVSSIRKATTLSAIFPGAGQIYNKSYWKLPFIVGGITTMVFVYDWNNRGYIRFTKAYEQVYAYEQGEIDEPIDEFNGLYSSTYMKSLRDSYRRNRDLSIIIAVGLYIFQIIDANVDAHLKDFDISDDLAVKVNPLIDYAYLPSSGSNSAIFGLNFGISF